MPVIVYEKKTNRDSQLHMLLCCFSHKLHLVMLALCECTSINYSLIIYHLNVIHHVGLLTVVYPALLTRLW